MISVLKRSGCSPVFLPQTAKSMRVLVLYAHPDDESFQAALHRTIVDELQGAGHEVDDCDLYAEGFNPILSRDERRGYHDPDSNRAPVSEYVARLQRAEALVLVFPVWNFGYPAILKGFFDRVFLPGVAFNIVDGKVQPCLDTIKAVTTVTTYGGAWWRAFLVGDPPRKCVMRVLRAIVGPTTPMRYLAHYDMNRSTDRTRARFLADVAGHMAAF